MQHPELFRPLVSKPIIERIAQTRGRPGVLPGGCESNPLMERNGAGCDLGFSVWIATGLQKVLP
jgi:hypothetical protein